MSASISVVSLRKKRRLMPTPLKYNASKIYNADNQSDESNMEKKSFEERNVIQSFLAGLQGFEP